MEYIIGGEHNDRKNVYKVINQLSVIREGVNLSYLISSQDKMSEAYMLAAALVGAWAVIWQSGLCSTLLFRYGHTLNL